MTWDTSGEPLRVLTISTLFPAPFRPGFGRFVANQAQAVAARDDIDLWPVNPVGVPPFPVSRHRRFRDAASCPPRTQLGDLDVRHVRFTTRPWRGPEANPAAIARAVLREMRSVHDEYPFDLVDAQFFYPDGPAAMIVADALGVPFTIKARGSDIHYWSTRPKALAQMKRAARAASGMLAVSAALKRDMVALGFPAPAIAVHYTGLERDRFRVRDRAAMRADAASRFGLPTDGPLLLVPGALIAIKGQALAIEALRSVPEARLALAGTGEDRAALEELAARSGLGERVRFLGQVGPDDLAGLMSAADVVVLPSEREGLANVWIEALACGTPLVIPPIGGAAEVVTGPQCGRIVARAPAAIAAAVREILADPPPPAAVAASVAPFSWTANAAALADFWRDCAA